MTHHKPPRGDHRPLAKPTFSHFDQQPSTASHNVQASNTGFREWLRKITSTDHGSVQVACEAVRLEHIRSILESMLRVHVVSMSRRDLRLYLKVISASRLATVREMRFDCFDLLCRKISEPVAVRKLREIDALLR